MHFYVPSHAENSMYTFNPLSGTDNEYANEQYTGYTEAKYKYAKLRG